jgi:hypothetical protein
MEWGSGRGREAASEEEASDREPAGLEGKSATAGGEGTTSGATSSADDSRSADVTDVEQQAPPEEDEGYRAARLPVPSWLVAVLIIATILVTYSALRIAGEQRYQSCVEKVSAQLGGATDNLSRLVRNQSVKRCSNSPF